MKLRGFLQAADAIVPCKTCKVAEGVPCKFKKNDEAPVMKTSKRGLVPAAGSVHISRRVARLLLTARNPVLRESFERDAVKLLKEYLREKRA